METIKSTWIDENDLDAMYQIEFNFRVVFVAVKNCFPESHYLIYFRLLYE